MSKPEKARGGGFDAVRHFDVNMYLAGIVPCPSCLLPVEIAGRNLDVLGCPYCGKPLFMPRKIHDYVLYRELGKGGVGRVFNAARIGSEERYAIKLARKDADDPAEARLHPLLREAEAGRALGSHPNIVEIVDFGICGGDVYLVSPFIAGFRLDQLIQAHARFGETRTLELARQLLRAEIHICGRGYLYRDLKPENILIEPSGKVRLLDYGICIPMNQAMNPPAIPLDEFEGSPCYLPPERILGQPESEASEIYSLGMLLLHMLTGRAWGEGMPRDEILREHLRPGPRSAGAGSERLRPEVRALIERMIAFEPGERPGFLAPLLDEVDELLEAMSRTPTVLLRRSDILRPPKG